VADRGTQPVEVVAAPPTAPALDRVAWWRRAASSLARYFRDNDPTFRIAFAPALAVAAVLFVRSPTSNYIFDEQEALLANPYVNGQELGWLDAFKRDFWGLPPARSIGSYRPLPNLVWRLLWQVSELPWLHHWVNVVGHAANAAVFASFAFCVTRRRRLSWLAGLAFVCCAVLTEAVTGVVGIADVLGGLGIVLGLRALALGAPLMTFAVFAATFAGLLCKESAIVAVPLLTWTALVTAAALHSERPRRFLRALLALLATLAALVAYTYLRRRLFPVTLPADLAVPLAADEPLLKRVLYRFLAWFQQPKLPQDPINNPLAEADFAHRVAGALRVYFRGLVQIVCPWRLSGDYSFAAEPVPSRLVFFESVAGAVALVLLPCVGAGLWLRAELLRRRRGIVFGAVTLLAVGLVWFPVAYFPHSNIVVVLPTVRAERFWYVPAFGTALCLAVVFDALLASRMRTAAIGVVTAFFGFQSVQARLHALDYTDDLRFWRATRSAVPNSAKAQLNYSVMVGARGQLQERLAVNRTALALAPQWPMAHIYYADTLCRLRRVGDAWPSYKKGFELAPNDPNLIALALQCLWDQKAIEPHRDELLSLADAHPGSWLAYLATDIVENGARHGGVEKKYRPRGYDEGPKK
jgi:hypothetical protein